MKSREALRSKLFLIFIVALAATAVAAVMSLLAGRPGLTARVFTASGPASTSSVVHTEIDASPSSDSVERLAASAGRGARITWDGLLHTDDTREYEIGLVTGAPARLAIDGRVLVEDSTARSLVEISNTVTLARGQHLLTLEYEHVTDRPVLELRWDLGNAYRLTTIPATALSPGALTGWRWQLRRYAPVVTAVVAVFWSGLLVWVLWRVLGRSLSLSAADVPMPLKVVLAGFVLLFGAGIWWGWPAAWAPDELDPGIVRDALRQHFSHGWFDKYPPLHYYLLALVYAPVLVAGQLHWLHVDAPAIRDLLFMMGRGLTLAMAVATLAVLALIAGRTFGRQHAWPTALCAGSFLPFVFYAKTVNVDGPYVFWFVVSLVFLAQAHEHGRLRDTLGFGVTAAAAIATKDQAYALYLLPSVHLAWRLARRPGGVMALAGGALAGLGVLLLCYNVLFNDDGFRQHVELITGPASDDYRMYPMTAAGEWRLAKTTASQLLWALGWPGAVLVLVGLVTGRRGAARAGLSRISWASLACVSYYLVFIAVVGYVYDRFLLPVTAVLALTAGVGLRRLLDGWPRPRLGRVAAAVLVAWLVWRVASVDALLIRDSRYAAEAWLRANVERNAIVVSVNEFGYVPRLDEFRHREILPTVAETLAVRPDFIVVNTEFLQRFAPDSAVREWLGWLESGAGPYREAFRYKAPLGWSALAWHPRFVDRREDDLTNLDKANPEIVIFRR